MLAGVLATCLMGLGHLTDWVWRKFRSPKKDLETRARGIVGEELNIVSDSDGMLVTRRSLNSGRRHPRQWL